MPARTLSGALSVTARALPAVLNWMHVSGGPNPGRQVRHCVAGSQKPAAVLEAHEHAVGADGTHAPCPLQHPAANVTEYCSTAYDICESLAGYTTIAVALYGVRRVHENVMPPPGSMGQPTVHAVEPSGGPVVQQGVW